MSNPSGQARACNSNSESSPVTFAMPNASLVIPMFRPGSWRKAYGRYVWLLRYLDNLQLCTAAAGATLAILPNGLFACDSSIWQGVDGKIWSKHGDRPKDCISVIIDDPECPDFSP